MNDANEIERPVINVELPAKHMEIRLVRANETYLFGSRGSLKTFRGIALFVIDMVYSMPRSTGVCIALSYEHLDKNTMGPFIAGLVDLGFKNGEHFIIDKKPPIGWPTPYLSGGIEKYDRTMTWHNGTVLKFISLARTAGANAISAQWGFGDEAKFMQPDKLSEIFPIFRGNDQYFGHLSCYLSKFFATDKLADPAEIEWLLKKRKLVNREKIEEIMCVQNHLNILQASYYNEELSKVKKQALKKEIFEIEKLLNKARSNTVFVQEINCYDVVDFMGIEWLKSARRNSKNQHVWEVAYENKDPDRPGESFYPSFGEVHQYDTDGDEDIDLSLPFIIAIDYQSSTIPIPVTQLSKLPGKEIVSLNIVDYIYTLSPKGLRDAVTKFCKKYEHHFTKRVYYCYDHTAIGSRTDADEYCVIVKNELKLYGWTTIDVYTGKAPNHYQKYSDTDDWLRHINPDQEEIRIHKRRCYKMVKAIKGTPTKNTMGKTEKDKKYENTSKYPDLDQSETTHVTDAFDTINDAVLKQKLIKVSVERIPVAFR